MKLVVAITQSEDAHSCMQALSERGLGVTRLHSAGGFLGSGNATLLLGVHPDQVAEAIEVIRANCRERTQVVSPVPPMIEPADVYVPNPLEVQVGGATIFVLSVERFEQL
ncbi:MAG: cyclic-di-AMP receptor [Candidatus Dormibacteria bacterium]